MPLPVALDALSQELGLDLGSQGHGLAPNGGPWVRWGKAGSEQGAVAGWYAAGTKSPGRLTLPDQGFWERVLGLATMIGNGRLDACHCIGPCNLCLGGPAFTLSCACDYGITLLWECLVECPDWWLHCMAPVVQETGVYPWFTGVTTTDYKTERGEPPTPALFRVEAGALLEEHSLTCAIRGTSDATRWTSKGKALAFKWVACVSKLLMADATVPAQVRVCQRAAPELLSAGAKEVLCWPRNGVADFWMWTPEQQRLWTVTMALALIDGVGASQLAEECVQLEPADARASLAAMAEKAAGIGGLLGSRVALLLGCTGS